MTVTSAKLGKAQALRAAAADALVWLVWVQSADGIAEFGRRHGLDAGVTAQNNSALEKSILALEAALKEIEP